MTIQEFRDYMASGKPIEGGITIDEGALIGHNVVLATLNHLLDPNQRAGMTYVGGVPAKVIKKIEV